MHRRDDSTHPVLAATFAALDEAAIKWCLLRGERDLRNPAGDVDILVARDDLARVRRIVAQLGFTYVPAWGYGSHVSFLTYDEATNSWIKLDFVTEVAFGAGFALATGAEQACLERRRRHGDVAVMDDGDAFWCLLLHAILDKRDVRPVHAAQLRHLADAECEWSPLADVVARVAPANWAPEQFVYAARQGRWDELVGAGRALKQTWTRRHPISVWRRRIANGARRWAGRVLRLRLRRGVVATLEGANRVALAAELERTFPFPVRVVADGPTTSWRITYHRARGRLVLAQSPRVAGDVTARAESPRDDGRQCREATTAIWRAYKAAWSRHGLGGAH
jgi:hypothetical protein